MKHSIFLLKQTKRVVQFRIASFVYFYAGRLTVFCYMFFLRSEKNLKNYLFEYLENQYFDRL